MNPFNRKVLFIAGTSLCALGVIFFLSKRFPTKKEKHLSYVATNCPDTWLESSGNCLFVDKTPSIDTVHPYKDYFHILNTDEIAVGALLNMGKNNGKFSTVADVQSSGGVYLPISYTKGDFSGGWVTIGDEFTSAYDKKQWANRNGIKWDGVS